jgi:hypothetical protein
MSVRRTLRRLVESKNGLVVPGAYDGCRRGWSSGPASRLSI